jgi:hypothetical protein
VNLPVVRKLSMGYQPCTILYGKGYGLFHSLEPVTFMWELGGGGGSNGLGSLNFFMSTMLKVFCLRTKEQGFGSALI